MPGKGFFRVDRRTWAAVCELGMNPAVAYLVLACGTGGDNRTTAWSATAVAEYAGIAWVRSKPAIGELCKAGFVEQTKTGSHPRYDLLDWTEAQEARKARTPHLDGYEAMVYDRIAHGMQPKSEAQRRTAAFLVQAGRVWCSDGQYVVHPSADDTPLSEQYIWLPQTLVMGTVAGEDSPLARVRRTGDVLTLRLLVDLYHAQHLRDDGGISRAVVYRKYDRVRVGEQGIYVVWSFSLASTYVTKHRITEPHWSKQPNGELIFWRRLRQLKEQGLIDFIPHLCESDSPDAEPIHPYGLDWSRQGLLASLENRVGLAAHCAGELMGKQPDVHTGAYLAPVPRDYPDVQMVGIARLRYRPQTRRTAQWWAILQTRLPGLIAKYHALRQRAEEREASRGIKGTQGYSRVFNGLQRVDR